MDKFFSKSEVVLTVGVITLVAVVVVAVVYGLLWWFFKQLPF